MRKVKVVSEARPIGTSPSLIMAFNPLNTLAVKVKYAGVCDVGGSGVSVGQGEDMVSGEVVNMAPITEFRDESGKPIDALIEFYAVSAVATSCRVTKIYIE